MTEQTPMTDSAPAPKNEDSPLFLLTLALILLILFGGGGMWLQHNTNTALALQHQLDRQGLITPGTITDFREVSGKSHSYYLTYQYREQGRNFTHECAVRESDYRSLAAPGQTVSVLYLPENPTFSRISQSLEMNKLRVNLMVSWIFMGTGLVFMVALSRKAYQIALKDPRKSRVLDTPFRDR
ncbi:MAG: DUF3592 domain-containing protein [Chthonomonadaceae bacterium]|nr:DUF3592 domain-containing protein [Chthonomonadaceae bacterium]